MAKVYLGLGSNKGDRLHFLSTALTETATLQQTRVRAVSSVYETEPVGNKDQGEFLNAVAEIDTLLSPQALLQELKRIEKGLGRKERVRWGPREIDIDILYYDEVVIADGTIKIPHGELANRRFVLIPLNEIAQGFVDPVRRLDIADLLKFCPDTSTVRRTKLKLFTGDTKAR
ncbi:MAG TPA: 2-amino-4-hydroxy-6-hydroxymethyldihydropteridine diphosphokinase [Bacteroidota bacterium]